MDAVQHLLEELPLDDQGIGWLCENATRAAASGDDPGLVRLWQHSLAVSVAARLLARLSARAIPREAYYAGLLHDVGRVVVVMKRPDEQREVLQLCRRATPLPLAEKEVLGLDHSALGARVALRWNMSRRVIEGIVHHHHPERACGSGKPLAAIVHAADVIVWWMGLGSIYLARPPALDPSVELLLDLHDDRIAEVEAEVRAELDRAERLFGIATPPPDSQRQALRAAYRELARLGNELEERQKSDPPPVSLAQRLAGRMMH